MVTNQCAVGDDAVVMTFYRAMHHSAKRGLAIACRPSVCLSVYDVDGTGSHRLKILETKCTNN